MSREAKPEKPRRVLLVGSPNVGKSVIFSRLTGTHVVAANYAGTTVEYTTGRLRLPDGEWAELVDVPGTYSLTPTNRAEEVAVEMLAGGEVIVNVIDATNLERGLNLTLDLLASGKPMLVVLNMWDETTRHGVTIDVERLSAELGVPVVTTCAVSGEGIRALTEKIPAARAGAAGAGQDKWARIGAIVGRVQRIEHRHPTLAQRLAQATVHPVLGPFIALVVMFLSFAFIAWFGEWLAEEVMERAFEVAWEPVVERISAALGGGGFLHDILIGNLAAGEIEWEESFGLLTTVLFIPLAIVLPFVFCFYLVLSVLEDIGYLPRLGTLVDNLMHRVGLHGFAIVPMMLGLGCNVPGAMAARILETRKEKFIAATLLSICVPCMGQIAMLFGLLGPTGLLGFTVLIASLLFLWTVLGLLMKRFVRGETPELLLEIPPYRLPHAKTLFKKVYIRVRGFVTGALPFVFMGVFFVNILYTAGFIDWLGRFLGPLITALYGLPEGAISALIVGFFQKYVAVGMIAPLELTTRQLLVASVVLTIYFPCVATFVVLLKELGWRDLLASALVMITVSILFGTGLNYLLRLLAI